MILEQEDKVISEFLRSMGPWNQYIVVGGGYALFEKCLRISMESGMWFTAWRFFRSGHR